MVSISNFQGELLINELVKEAALLKSMLEGMLVSSTRAFFSQKLLINWFLDTLTL